MQLSLSIGINASPSDVWTVIADIEHSADTIRGIDKIEVLERPKGPSITGLKWRETRTMFGREATEVMWVTDAKEPEHYDTRAESHGSVYVTRLSVGPIGDGARLTMAFEGVPQTFGSRLMWALTGWMARGAMRKALQADLEDIKAAAEAL